MWLKLLFQIRVLKLSDLIDLFSTVLISILYGSLELSRIQFENPKFVYLLQEFSSVCAKFVYFFCSKSRKGHSLGNI